MTNTPSLLPCPFCGGMATAKPIDSVPGWHHVTVLHSDCFYKPAQDKMLLNDEHLAAWNRRTPQPVVREPLTENQVSELANSAGYWHGDTSRADFINGIRYAEAANGIKGGQHGTE